MKIPVEKFRKKMRFLEPKMGGGKFDNNKKCSTCWCCI